MSKTERVIYEIDGKRLYGTPLTTQHAETLGLQYCDPNEPCSGDYICIDGTLYRCVLNVTGHGCVWLITSEVC